MRGKKSYMAVLAGVLLIGLPGCANDGEVRLEATVPVGNSIQEETTQSMSTENEEQEDDIRSEPVLTDAGLEEELNQYRREREELIRETNGLVEGGTPDEGKYSFDLSHTFYESQFDTKELTEAYAVARVYVADTLGIEPGTKMVTYMCIDPRMLAIYDDEDKGVAAGYDNSDIFVCEYSDADGVWQYLILVREGKGSAWNVIYNGKHYRE